MQRPAVEQSRHLPLKHLPQVTASALHCEQASKLAHAFLVSWRNPPPGQKTYGLPDADASVSWAQHNAAGGACLVSVLLQSRLVLQIGAAGREPAGLGVDVEAAVDAAQLALAVPGRNLAALQGLDEVAEQGVDGTQIAQSINCTPAQQTKTPCGCRCQRC